MFDTQIVELISMCHSSIDQSMHLFVTIHRIFHFDFFIFGSLRSFYENNVSNCFIYYLVLIPDEMSF